MKNTLIISLFVSITFFSFGKDPKSDSTKIKHELSILVEDFLQKSPNYYYDYYPYYDGYNYPYMANVSTTKIGLGYRMHFNKFAIRSRVLLNYSNSNQQNNNYKIATKLFESNFALGIELHKNIGKAQLFYGIDLGLKQFSNSYKYTFDDVTNTQVDEVNNKTTTIQISPLFGFKYQFHPAISISTELRFNLEKYISENETKYKDFEDGNSLQKSDGFQTKFGPVGFLSLNFHF